MFWNKKKQERETSENISMITPEEYLLRYLAWELSGISSSDLSPQTCYYQSFSAMALPMLQMEAEHHVPGAVEELGERYLYGLDGLQKDFEKAKTLFEKAAELGHPEANGMLAKIYTSDQYAHKDMKLYFDFLKKGAERGGWLSMFNLSCAYYKGKEQYGGFGFDRDKALALKWSMQASTMTRALLRLVFTKPCTKSFAEYNQNMYRIWIQSTCVSAEQMINGDGVKRDIAKAREWLQEAARHHVDVLHRPCAEFEKLLKECN